MGITNVWHGYIVLGIWLSTISTIPPVWSDTHDENLLPPNNITLKMNLFKLKWEWTSKNNIKVCKIKYVCSIANRNFSEPLKSCRRSVSFYEQKTNELNLNEWIHFKVRAECDDDSRKSKEANYSTLLLSGVPNTAVRNFSCVWYNMTSIKCKWLPGENAPRNVNYTLLYWQENENDNMELKVPHSTLFKDFLNTANFCHPHVYAEKSPHGCNFEMQNENAKLQFVVTDLSNKNIEPFYSRMTPSTKLQFSPPIITNVSRIDKYTLNVSWDVPQKINPMEFEIKLTNLNIETPSIIKVTNQHWMELNVNQNIPYAVEVRSRLCFDNNYPWSDWSLNKTVSGGESSFWTTNIILAILIPVSVTILTIISIVCMKRFLSCIFPPIPNPRKMFEKSFGDTNNLQQHFMKYKSVEEDVWSTAQKDEICDVILVEPLLCSSSAE